MVLDRRIMGSADDIAPDCLSATNALGGSSVYSCSLRTHFRWLVVLTCLVASGAEKPWWEREPLRIIDMSASLGGDGYRDPAGAARRKAALHYNAEHLEV